MKILNIVMLLTTLVLVFATLSCTSTYSSGGGYYDHGRTDAAVLQAAGKTLEALVAQDGKQLALLVHPRKGVRFSPSAFVDVASDVVFSRTQVETIWTDEKSYTWGFAEGTGDPIVMTPSQYCRAYIMDRDFLNPSSISVNNDRAVGNTNNNAALVYPEGSRVEYFIESSVRNGEPVLDWAALRLVFERSGDAWYLIAVIHDEWGP